MNKVGKHRIRAVANSLKENKSYKQAMLENGYSKDRANQGIHNKVIQEALSKNKQEFINEGVTVEGVRLNLQENRALALKKGDISSMNRADELLGKMIAAFTDKIDQTVKDLTPQMEEKIHNYIQESRLGEN